MNTMTAQISRIYLIYLNIKKYRHYLRNSASKASKLLQATLVHLYGVQINRISPLLHDLSSIKVCSFNTRVLPL